MIPKVRVKGDDAQAVVIFDRVSAIMGPGLGGPSSIDPAFILPQGSDVVKIPTLLLAEVSW